MGRRQRGLGGSWAPPAQPLSPCLYPPAFAFIPLPSSPCLLLALAHQGAELKGVSSPAHAWQGEGRCGKVRTESSRLPHAPRGFPTPCHKLGVEPLLPAPFPRYLCRQWGKSSDLLPNAKAQLCQIIYCSYLFSTS